MLPARSPTQPPPRHHHHHTPPPPPPHTTTRPPQAGANLTPDRTSRRRAFRAYLDALVHGTLITSLPRLSLEESLASAGPRGGGAAAAAAAFEPSPAQAEFLAQLAAMPKDETDRGRWVLRRHGYSERENPQRIVTIMQSSGGVAPGGMGLQMSSWDGPTPAECLEFLRTAIDAGAFAPIWLMVDQKKSIEPLTPVLAAAGVTVVYYPPPSEEERATAAKMDVPLRLGCWVVGLVGH